MNLAFGPVHDARHIDTRMLDEHFVAYGYIGEPLTGVENLTLRTKPPTKPQPEDEQGVGRAAPQAWARTDHPIHDNPDWYLAQPEMFDLRGSNAALQTVISNRQWHLMQLDYYQNHEASSSPGETQPTTVEGGTATPYSQLAVLG